MTPQWQVFCRTSLANHEGTAVHTVVIPANGKKHAIAIAESINAANTEGSYLRSSAIIIGSD